jgi:hypothetical protein
MSTPYGNTLEAEIDVPLGECTVGSLAHLRGLFVANGVLFSSQNWQRECFSEGGEAFLTVHQIGAGVVVQLGDNELFTNRLLRYADNGPLATALLTPTDHAHVHVLVGSGPAKATSVDAGSGDKTLSDLVRPGVWMAFAQLAIAFVVFSLARAIRPGRPVREPEQVPVAGSELVVATGNLMHRAKHASRAGWILRGKTHRTLCERFHLPATTSIDALDEAVAARTTLPRGHVAAVLHREVFDDADLLRLSNDLHSIREKIRDATPEGVPS